MGTPILRHGSPVSTTSSSNSAGAPSSQSKIPISKALNGRANRRPPSQHTAQVQPVHNAPTQSDIYHPSQQSPIGESRSTFVCSKSIIINTGLQTHQISLHDTAILSLRLDGEGQALIEARPRSLDNRTLNEHANDKSTTASPESGAIRPRAKRINAGVEVRKRGPEVEASTAPRSEGNIQAILERLRRLECEVKVTSQRQVKTSENMEPGLQADPLYRKSRKLADLENTVKSLEASCAHGAREKQRVEEEKNNKIANLESELKELGSRCAVEACERERIGKEKDMSIADLEKSVKALNENCAKKSTNAREAEGRNRKLCERVLQLETENGDHAAKLEHVVPQCNHLREERDELQRNHDWLKAWCLELERERNTIQVERSEYKDRLEDLQAKYEKIQTDGNQVRGQLATLRPQHDGLQNEKYRLENELRSAIAELELLRESHSSVEVAYNNSEEERSDIEDKIKSTPEYRRRPRYYIRRRLVENSGRRTVM
ncbi:hypothetical protein FQN54_002941 [Arachnomyces sp. PD_36]|nr:hypothetical protein FQN54_002941 [Arachnomyces sp. PD_36]